MGTINFDKLADNVARATGRPVIFAISVIAVLLWAFTGPLFRFSDTWQLVVNTGTSIVTFLMVFLIQNTQNRDTAALQAKLDELIRSSKGQNASPEAACLSDEELNNILSLSGNARGRPSFHLSNHVRHPADKRGATALNALTKG